MHMALARTAPTDLDGFRLALQQKRAELKTTHLHTDAIAIERIADSMEELVMANERDLALEQLNRESLLLRQVRDALDRMAAGVYGVCLQCEQPIAARRLSALPWAPLCLNCQEAADSERTVEAGAGWITWLSGAA
jgi:DnaK suppressor protein